MKGSSEKHATTPDTFAGALARRAGLRQVRFAIPARDYPPIARAKRCFGTAGCFNSLTQSPLATVALKRLTYADAMGIAAAVPTYRTALGLLD